MENILITGGAGLIGSHIAEQLAQQHQVFILDSAYDPADKFHGNILDLESLQTHVRQCTGIIHLAAVSRVVTAQLNPDLCWRTNVGGTRNLLAAAHAAPRKPWVILSSSREVYGRAAELPVSENCRRNPINVYARSKVAVENLAQAGRAAGIATSVLRFSNVYGSTEDYPDRVVPAFCRAAASGAELRVEGGDRSFDFTHVDDVARGIKIVVELLVQGERCLPTMHLLTGEPTSLNELANFVTEAAESGATIRTAPPRNYDVEYFFGDPTLSEQYLGWKARTTIRQGALQLMRAFQKKEEAKEFA